VTAAAARDEVPAARLGTPHELADAAVFLCSARASCVTGEFAARRRRPEALVVSRQPGRRSS
jgi:NAD(P)-dependent dehydrogenase (short-subunit alcohol dehydrogenase family)